MINLERTPSSLLALTLLLVPWVGVGTGILLTGRSFGMGLQPALIAGGLLLVVLTPRAWGGRLDRDGWAVLAAAIWTGLSTIALWRLDHLGMAGEVPWLKSLKQLLVLLLLLGLACAPAVILASATDKTKELQRFERAASVGLLLAAVYGLGSAIHFYVPIPGLDRLAGWVTSNPSIAAGSHELYLGHRFVGIPRVAGPTCEPLYFGSYLLAVVPITWLAASRMGGASRVWRLVAASLGTLCLVLTFSRGVYLGGAVLACGLGLGLWRGRVRVREPRRLVVVGLVLMGVVALLATPLTRMAPWEIPGLLVRRLLQSFQSHDMSNLTRMYAWKAAGSAFLSSPFTGIGWGGFGFWFYTLVPEGAGAHFGWPVTNSLPLRFLAETGLVGVGLWTMAIRPVFAGLRVRAETSQKGDGLSFFLAVVCLAALAQSLTFSQLQLPHLWLLLGTTAAVSRERFRLV